MSLIRRVARPMLAAMFVVGGLDQLRNPGSKVEGARPLVTKLADVSGQEPDVELAVRANGTAMVLGGALLGTGFAPRLGATILVGSLLPTTISGHPFWSIDDPQQRTVQRIQFLKNTGLLGGLLLAVVDTEGKPGLKYRAGMVSDSVERNVKQTRKEARRAAKTARREAKLAAAQARNAIS